MDTHTSFYITNDTITIESEDLIPATLYRYVRWSDYKGHDKKDHDPNDFSFTKNNGYVLANPNKFMDFSKRNSVMSTYPRYICSFNEGEVYHGTIWFAKDSDYNSTKMALEKFIEHENKKIDSYDNLIAKSLDTIEYLQKSLMVYKKGY